LAGSKRLGAGYIETRGWFCFEHMCPTVIARTITFRDSRHMTGAYALRLAGVFRTAFRAAVRR